MAESSMCASAAAVTSLISPETTIAEIRDRRHERQFLNDTWKMFPATSKRPASLIIVCHLIEDSLSLIGFLKDNFDIEAIIPKPKSINQDVLARVLDWGLRVEALQRAEISAYGERLQNIVQGRKQKKLVVLDMGGYFSSCAEMIKKDLRYNFCGIVEDTENGLQRYQTLSRVPVPVYSVADSTLKRPENLLVGLSIVDGAIKILKESGFDVANITYGLIGFGKIGEEIAHHLRRRQKNLLVFDKDPIKMVHAKSLGYRITKKKNLLAESDILLSITGGRSLSDSDLTDIKKGAVIASVTSSDDEFGFSCEFYKNLSPCGHLLDKFALGDSCIYLINRGNAVNFAVNPNIGESICILQGEIVCALRELTEDHRRHDRAIKRVTQECREAIAAMWVDHFAEELSDREYRA
jgi:adenosylhomocysteinase